MARAIKMIAVIDVNKDYLRNISFQELCRQVENMLYEATGIRLSLVCKKVSKIRQVKTACEVSSIVLMDENIKIWKESVLELVESISCVMQQKSVNVEFQEIDICTITNR